MQLFLENLPGICLLIALLSCLVCASYAFMTMPRDKQLAALKEWLKLAVTEAEKYLGSGTGQLKLRYVYEKAILQFPWLTRMISFEDFSGLVDEALEWLNKQIESNVAIQNYLKG